MSRHDTLFLLVLLTIFGLLPATPSLAIPLLPSQRATAQVVSHLIESKQVHGLVAGFVTPAGRAIYGFGRQGETRRSKAPDGSTVFEIGSITKTFTGTLLAQAVMEGRLRLTDPIRLALPEDTLTKQSPLYWVSYLDLATHTSGLPGMPANMPGNIPRNPFAGYSTGLLLNYLPTATLLSPIGQEFYYSNTGAGLCGYLLGRLAGQDYESLVVSRLCDPLLMRDTRITLTPDMAARMTHGHDDTGQIVPNWEVTGLEGAGAFRSTAEDLLTYASANLGLVPSSFFPAMKLAQLPRKHVSSIPTFYLGLFWNIMNFGGKEYVLHTGRSGGYFAFLLLSPEDNAGIVLLCDTEGDFSKEGWKLLETLIGKSVSH